MRSGARIALLIGTGTMASAFIFRLFVHHGLPADPDLLGPEGLRMTFATVGTCAALAATIATLLPRTHPKASI